MKRNVNLLSSLIQRKEKYCKNLKIFFFDFFFSCLECKISLIDHIKKNIKGELKDIKKFINVIEEILKTIDTPEIFKKANGKYIEKSEISLKKEKEFFLKKRKIDRNSYSEIELKKKFNFQEKNVQAKEKMIKYSNNFTSVFGIEDKGDDGFFNSVLQCLNSSRKLVDYYLKSEEEFVNFCEEIYRKKINYNFFF